MRANHPLRQWMAPPSTRLVRMKVTLENVHPTVWRRFLVPAGFTLRQLHRVLMDTMGWHDSHLHQFIVRGNYYGKTDPEFGLARRDERLHNLEHVLALGVRSFRYEYDFGDGWMHRIAIEKVEEADGRPLKPVCLAGKRACPPEDSGGPGATPSYSTCSVTPLTRITRTRRPGPVLASTPSDSTSTASAVCSRRSAEQSPLRALERRSGPPPPPISGETLRRSRLRRVRLIACPRSRTSPRTLPRWKHLSSLTRKG
jgi:hypothetical protein